MSASLPLPNDHESPKFRPGNLAWHVRDWQDITADDWIINQIIGVKLDFNQIPEQLVRPRQYRMSAKQKSILQLEIDKLIDNPAGTWHHFDVKQTLKLSHDVEKPDINVILTSMCLRRIDVKSTTSIRR